MTQPPTIAQLHNLTDRAATGLTADEQARLRAGVDRLEQAEAERDELRDEIATAGAKLADMAKSRSEWEWRAGDAERRVRCQRERAETAEAGQLLLARTIAATSKQTVEQVLADVRAALAPAQEPTP